VKLENSEIHALDEKQFKLVVEPNLRQGKEINIFFSLTHMNPTYLLLFRLKELKNLTDLGNFRVFVTMWDMNAQANPYFKRLSTTGRIKDTSSFIDEKLLELKNIMLSLGFEREKLHLYKSSDLWKRLIAYKEEDLFQEFYHVLANMQTKTFPDRKISHVVQNSLDLFFCNYMNKLYPEDTNKEIDVAFFGSEKEKIYVTARDKMHKEGLTRMKPLFVQLKDFPYMEHDLNIPNWNQNLETIKDIVINSSLSKEKILKLFEFLGAGENKIRVKENKETIEISYSEFNKEYKGESKEKLTNLLSDNLYSYLMEHKKKYLEVSHEIVEEVLNISKIEELKNIGNVLRSEIALKILFKADGTKTITQCSKELGKSVATISIYANRLRKMNLLRTLPGGKLKRNIKAFKINLGQDS